MRPTFPALCLLLLLLLPARWSGAAELQMAYLEDPQGLLRVEQLDQAGFRPFRGVLARGFGPQAVWVRLQLPPRAEADWMLRVRPSFLDHIEVHLPAGDGWQAVDIGDRAPLFARGVPDAVPNLRLPAAATRQTVYVRVRSSSTLQFHAELVTQRRVFELGLRQTLLMVLHLAAMSLILCWAVGELLRRRDPVLLAFLPYQALNILFAPVLLGHAALLWPDQPLRADALTSLTVLLLPPAALLFHGCLLRSAGAPRWLLALCILLAMLWTPALPLWLFDQEGRGLAWNAMLTVLIAGVFLGAALGLRRSDPLGLAWLRGLYALQGLALLLQMAVLLGWVQGVQAHLYGSLVQGLLSALLVFLLLWLRARALRRRELQALAELAEVRLRAVHERELRERSEALVSMLAHELRTPLSVISLALARADPQQRSVQLARNAVDDMGGLLARCLDVSRLEAGEQAMQAEPLALGDLLAEIAGRLDAGARLQCQLAVGVVQADRSWLSVVLRNLLENALRYSPPDSPVQVAAQEQADGIEIRIDNALAGPAPDPARVFERYYRGPAALSRSGAGLGLYLVKRLVEQMRGEIGWQAQDGHASIRLWLPR